MHRIKTAIVGLLGTGASYGSYAASTTDAVKRMEPWLQAGTLLAGTTCSIIAIYWMGRINRTRSTRENLRLCETCRMGHLPAHCPIPVGERPDDCPLSATTHIHRSKT